MIKITSFYPFQSLLRVTQEFHDEKVIVKIKSLTYEREFEFEYKDIGEISDAFFADSSQMDFGFWLLFFSGITLTVFWSFIYANLVLLRVEQILYVCGLVLYVIGFKKSWRIYVSDRNDKVLTFIKQTRQNSDLIPQAIEMIRNKSENVQEITTASPFPTEKFAFEHVDYDIRNMIKTTDRFYENEIIGFQKNMFRESVYNIKYAPLSGKIYRGKSGSNILCESVSLIGLIISIALGFIYGFGINLGIGPSQNLEYFLYSLLALGLFAWLLGFIKREVIGLYDKNGNIAYWTYIKRADKDNIEKIIKFIQSRILPEPKNQLLKEQP